ncbi:hypothetical protein E2320_016368, partial [Naja naja]
VQLPGSDIHEATRMPSFFLQETDNNLRISPGQKHGNGTSWYILDRSLSLNGPNVTEMGYFNKTSSKKIPTHSYYTIKV